MLRLSSTATRSDFIPSSSISPASVKFSANGFSSPLMNNFMPSNVIHRSWLTNPPCKGAALDPTQITDFLPNCCPPCPESALNPAEECLHEGPLVSWEQIHTRQ